MKFLVLQHEAASPLELLDDWIRERGHTRELLDVPSLEEWPNPREFGAVISLGSDCSVHADAGREPWIEAEVGYLRRAHELGVPLLGLCFGGQALARALGGRVRRADFVEAGWTPIEEPRSEVLGSGPWFRWHEDVFSVPQGARELARSEVGPLAFSLGRSMALQFHPETTATLIETWIDGARDRLGRDAIDPDRLHDEIAAASPGARDRAFALFDRIERFWGDVPSP